MIWYGLHLLAWLIVLSAVAPALALSSTAQGEGTSEKKLRFTPGLPWQVVYSYWSVVSEIQSLGGLLVVVR